MVCVLLMAGHESDRNDVRDTKLDQTQRWSRGAIKIEINQALVRDGEFGLIQTE